MAIQFARIGHSQRAKGANACCKGAYNSRQIIKDLKTGEVYNFEHKKDNVYHEVLLPGHANEKTKKCICLDE